MILSEGASNSTTLPGPYITVFTKWPKGCTILDHGSVLGARKSITLPENLGFSVAEENTTSTEA